MTTPGYIQVCNLTMAYGNRLIQQDLNFEVQKGDIFFIMGGSGSGKSTLLKHMIGLFPPAEGEILYAGTNFFEADEATKLRMLKQWGITYQSGAMFSSMTLAENVALPVQQYTPQSASQVAELVEYKLALVGLSGYQDYYPAEVSGGMLKRAALARAIALDPALLFFDEPSAGLDPISSRLLDDLIVELGQALGATVIIVSHELDSILSIGTNSVFLDTTSKTMLDSGNPRHLRDHSDSSKVKLFLSRSARESRERALG